jgi:hypothetical protein
MTTPNDLPPVGATVTDADGTSYVRLGSWNAQRDEIEYCWVREVESLGTKGLVEVLEPSGLAAVLTALWRMQQERDQLKEDLQHSRELRIAISNDLSDAKARVAELEGVCMAADACVDALRDLAGDSHAEYIGAYDAVSVHPTWPPRGVDEARMADLEQERDRLKARVAELEEDAARYAYCRTGQWVRRSASIGWDAATDSELMEERTFLEVPVLKGSDLSCHAWVDRAIDAARAAQEGT